MQSLKIALAQINSTVGDIAGNLQKISDCLENARAKGIDLIAFPELALTGYPPEDLLLQPHFIMENQKALDQIATNCFGLTAIIGFVHQTTAGAYNAAAIISFGKIQFICHKAHLPNYSVFDEARYFQPGQSTPPFSLKGISIGVNICEDLWVPNGPTKAQAEAGAQLIINISASPYRTGITKIREALFATRAKENRVCIAYVNLIGGQDELVFDGNSLIVNQTGKLLARGKSFEEDLLIANLSFFNDRSAPLPKKISEEEEIYRALTLGLFDYTRKNRFKKVAIGLSGGIDSALTAVIAVDALGPDQVVGVFMPSRYTSKESATDAKKLAKNLGIEIIAISIEPVFTATLVSLQPHFLDFPEDTTEENLQSRIRGNIMMALSNKFGWLVLTTGNKSELSVGYATLYGDMAGGFSLIKDLWKTVVYRLANWRNQGLVKPFPKRILTRPPTAELRPNQADSDSLPPYDQLDPILKAYIEENQSFDQIVLSGFNPATVAQVMILVDRSEFKRRQAPVGVRITPRGLGKDRRMPITNGYKRIETLT